MSDSQADKAKRFKELHEGPGSFVIPNPWDGATARILEALGYPALATSSGACAATFGRRDGNVTRDEAMAHSRLIVESTGLPVSADFEKGFGDDPATVHETIRMAADTGLVGASIEDSTRNPDAPLYDFDQAVARVAAAVEAARALPYPFMLVARAQNFVAGKPDLDDTIKRLQAFEKVGADVLFAPGLPDLDAIKAVCQAVKKPVNFMVGIPHRSFTVADLTAAGVKRISLSTALHRAAMDGFVKAAKETSEQGTFGYVEAAIPSRELGAYLEG
ncbi:MAG: isocitrate lyase/phosphoenolpyruvate mutase family protein [Dehalococcoidia bacterium]